MPITIFEHSVLCTFQILKCKMDMPPIYFQKEKARKKMCHNRSMLENLLLNLNFKDSDLHPQNLDKEYSEIFQITSGSSSSVSNPNLTEENVLNSIEANVTQLTFDITKGHDEYRALLTGVTNDIQGSSFALAKKNFHCYSCSQRDLNVTFSPGYVECMDDAEPYIPLAVTVQRAVLIVGCQKKAIIDYLAHDDDTPLIVCRTDSTNGKFIVAPASINTHSLSFFFKFNGIKKINHVFNVTNVDVDLYRKYLILMTLTYVSNRQIDHGSFPSCTLFPFSSIRHDVSIMLNEDDDT